MAVGGCHRCQPKFLFFSLSPKNLFDPTYKQARAAPIIYLDTWKQLKSAFSENQSSPLLPPFLAFQVERPILVNIIFSTAGADLKSWCYVMTCFCPYVPKPLCAVENYWQHNFPTAPLYVPALPTTRRICLGKNVGIVECPLAAILPNSYGCRGDFAWQQKENEMSGNLSNKHLGLKYCNLAE